MVETVSSQGAVAGQGGHLGREWLGHEAPSQQPSSIPCGAGQVLVQGLWVRNVKSLRQEFSPGCSKSVTKGASLGWEAKGKKKLSSGLAWYPTVSEAHPP